MIAMLSFSVLAVLAAAGWWWVTWPERTAREFVRLIEDGEDGHWHRLLSVELARIYEDLHYMTGGGLQPRPQSVLDFCSGRRVFMVGANLFVVQRGRVVDTGFVLDGEDITVSRFLSGFSHGEPDDESK